MILARIIPVVALAGVLGLSALADRDPDPAPAVSYGSVTAPVMPAVAGGSPLSTSWYCPGVPASRDAAAGTGVVSVLNPGDSVVEGSMTVYPTEGDPAVVPLSIKERSRVDVRPADVAAAPWAGAVVELLGAQGVVEQSAAGPTGRSSSACATSAGTSWYLADGATTVDANLQLLLFNPFPGDAILDISFATGEGARQPQATQGFVVRGRSVRLLALNDIVRREPAVATQVVARSGRVVVGRVQTYTTGPKRAFAVGLAAPSTSSQWWFATGDKGDRAAERVSILNPGETDAEVSVAFYPNDPTQAQAGDPVDVTVPGGAAVSVDVATNDGVVPGPHSILVLTDRETPVVAERTLELQGDTARTVTMQVGSPLTSTTWTFVTGVPGGVESLVLANATGEAATVAVRALGPAGFTAVPGYESVPVAAAGGVRLDLDEKGVAGLPIVVEATTPIVAERVAGAPAGQLGISIAAGVPSVADS